MLFHTRLVFTQVPVSTHRAPKEQQLLEDIKQTNHLKTQVRLYRCGAALKVIIIINSLKIPCISVLMLYTAQELKTKFEQKIT